MIENLVFQQISGIFTEMWVEFKHVLQQIEDLWSGVWELFLELDFAVARLESFDVIVGRWVSNKAGIFSRLVAQNVEDKL